jgi:phosphoglycerate dehydrogenase-like enzyme
MTQLLILLTLPEQVRTQYYNGIRARFPDIEVNIVDHNIKVDPYIADTDVLVTFGPMMAEHVLEKAVKLKWIQALGSGVDGITDRPALRSDVVVTNLHGIHGPPVSEAALMAMLALARGLARTVRNQQQHKWARTVPPSLLKGKTVVIFGVGVISSELAPKCKALGMRVLGVSSTARQVPGFDHVHARGELEQAAGEADYLVLLTPYSAATRGSIGANIFAAMKPTSYLVNLARGGVVDEDAMMAALRQGRIAGAALDVFSQEPLPDSHPLWAMDNVLITPHQGGFYDDYVNEALPVIEHNLHKFLAGDTAGMTNLVKR